MRMRIVTSVRGALAQWIERVNGDGGLLGSNPGRAASELCQFRFNTPLCQSRFGGDTESRWSLLSGVCTRRSKISHTWPG